MTGLRERSSLMLLFMMLLTLQAAASPLQAPAAQLSRSSTKAVNQQSPQVSKEEIIGFVLAMTGKWRLSWKGSTAELHQGDGIPNDACVVPESKDGSIIIGLVDIDRERLRFAAANGPSAPITLANPPSGVDNWIAEAIENLTNNTSGWVDPICRSVELQCKIQLLKAIWLE